MKTLMILAFALLIGQPALQAQKVAVVDINLILESLDDYKSAQTEVDKIAARWRQEIEQEFDKVKGMYNKYQAEQVLMSEEMRQQQEQEILTKEKDIREMQKAKFGPEGELFKKRQELIRPVQDKVYGLIESYANERGYDFIFDKSSSSGIIFANPQFDKTEDLIQRLARN
ncbi:MAG: OmpH family outer membrane protein [Lewinellaceae bacterium]|nr:OmpH family outer membrane protein [Lewinellaceae bacterium]